MEEHALRGLIEEHALERSRSKAMILGCDVGLQRTVRHTIRHSSFFSIVSFTLLTKC